MLWFILIVLLSVASTGLSINRPVFKIVLKQKGYAQFLQYDLETPPLREFTICTWIRVYELNGEQTIFTYVANGNNRVVRLWLNTGGKRITVSINGKITSASPVDITKDVWRHICLSYQSDYGAWALYVDSRIVSCQASQRLQGFVLPGNGSVIIGYGTADGGASNGLEGEIFGTNMILVSTIERNYTVRNDPFYRQQRIIKNKMKDISNRAKYIILNDLQTGELKNNFETTQLPLSNSSKSFIKFKTPHSFIEHAVGLEYSSKKPLLDTSDRFNKDFVRLTVTETPEQPDGLSFWNLTSVEHTGKYNVVDKNHHTAGPISLSEYETPPPPPKLTSLEKTLDKEKAFPLQPYKFKAITDPAKSLFNKPITEELSEVETPPPIGNNAKVYGQWTSSKFASNVLNYLKNMQLRTREQRKIPPTIPLTKYSDSFPYTSDFKITKMRPPVQFQRRNIVEKQFETSKRVPQINLQLDDDLRKTIIKTHAKTKPKNVDVTNRGLGNKKHSNRLYRNVDSQESNEGFEPIQEGKPLFIPKQKSPADMALQTNNLLSILPFLKSLEYFVENSQQEDTVKDQSKDIYNNMYTKNLSGNKWHNVKSYSNDYTPREFSILSGSEQRTMELSQVNKRQPGVRLNFKHENRNVKLPYAQDSMENGRALALEVSNQSNYNRDFVSLLKYNHGFLPGHKKTKEELHGVKKEQSQKDSFDKEVKIGNALNERHVIGTSKDENKKSFVGGDESIPDINKFTSNLDNIDTLIHGSLGLRACSSGAGGLDRTLYIQDDESIDMTRIASPVRQKNIGIEFILQNYKKCSLEESVLQDNPMLFIDWSRTPVSLFGGSYPKKTTDLCGFF